MKTIFQLLVVASLTAPSLSAQSPDEILTSLAKQWSASGWGADGNKDYMRPIEDEGWKARMTAMQQLVKASASSIPALSSALRGDDVEMQIFAAQTMGYLPKHAPADLLTEELKSNPNPAVRLYAADALGMRGGTEFTPLFKELVATEKNRDVKKHLGYAVERGGQPVASGVIETLKTWDPDLAGSAVVGEPAPDFQLKSLGGDTIQLSQYRGESAVVLVFIYGDT